MKLIMFDLDGTLLSQMHEVSVRNREAIKKLYHLGYHLGVATGRRVANVEEILGEDVAYFDVIIGENGYETKDLKANQSIYTSKLKRQHIKEIIELFNDETKDINFCYFNEEATYYYRHSSMSTQMEQELGRKVIYTNGELFDDLPKMCMPVGPELAEEFRGRVEAINHPEYHGTMTGYGFFEFMSKETSKWQALEKYMKQHNYTIEDSVAFGDSGNDMEILSHVGIGIAMQNADDKVKAVCQDITQYANTEDGVGRYIENHWL